MTRGDAWGDRLVGREPSIRVPRTDEDGQSRQWRRQDGQDGTPVPGGWSPCLRINRAFRITGVLAIGGRWLGETAFSIS